MIPDDFEAIGSDCDGLVNKLKPSVDIKITDEATVYENEHVNGDNERGQIMFWGGIDIRNRYEILCISQHIRILDSWEVGSLNLKKK